MFAKAFRTRVSPAPVLVAIGYLLATVQDQYSWGIMFEPDSYVVQVIVCATATYLAVECAARSLGGWMWGMVGVALLFNPVSPLDLSRDLLALFEVTIAWFFVGAYDAASKRVRRWRRPVQVPESPRVIARLPWQ